MKTRTNDEAVSPVVGVILMVAITVIMAAIVAAFVFGIAGEQKVSHAAGFSAEKIAGQQIRVSFITNGGDDVKITSADIYIGDTKTSYASPKVGQQFTFPGPYKNQTHVRVVTTYEDGTTFPALDKYL